MPKLNLYLKRLDDVTAVVSSLVRQYERAKHLSPHHNQLYEQTREAKRCLLDALQAGEKIEGAGEA
jgi:hypothetical protein